MKVNPNWFTLNGSAMALPRIMAALLENNQTPEGIKLPKKIAEYARFELINYLMK
jgi:seryl-tRNA synthetase